MRRRIKCSVSILVVCLIVAVPSLATERAWTKYHQSVEIPTDSGTKVLAEFTTIVTSDTEFPFLSRILYEDEQGRRLVIRKEFLDDTGFGTTTIEWPDKSESVSFELAPNHSLTVSRGEQSLVVDVQTTLAEMGPDPLSFRPVDRAAGLTLIAGATENFRSTLRTLAEVGVYESMFFTGVGNWMSQLFFHDIQSGFPAKDSTSMHKTKVVGFDPLVVAPGPFEQEFGDAYFE